MGSLRVVATAVLFVFVVFHVVESKMLSRDGKNQQLRVGSDTIASLNEEIETLTAKVRELENPKDMTRFKEAKAKTETTNRLGDESMCQFDNCNECTAQQSCGWCPVLQKCVEGDLMGPTSAVCTLWHFEMCPTSCSDFSDCNSCTSTDRCGFCFGLCRCMEGGASPDFGPCDEGWYHSKGTKKCPRVQKWPGDPSQSPTANMCSDAQYRVLRAREVLEQVDKADTWRVKEQLEKSDVSLW